MFKHGVNLSEHSSYKIGGPAREFFAPKSKADLIEGFTHVHKKGVPLFVLGGGTNVLFHDEGFDGVIIRPAMKEIRVSGDEITAEAGALLSDVVGTATEAGLSGLEWAGGLPGTLGGAIRGNAGAFGGEIKDSVTVVGSVDGSGTTHKRDTSACEFAYRTSIFKQIKEPEIITAATLSLVKGDKKKIRESVQEKIDYRNERHPMEYPNVGSIFKNVDARNLKKSELKPFEKVIKDDPFPVIPTAYLVSEAGLKGVTSGGVMISPKHPNFMVNILDGTAEDVRNLIALVRSVVQDRFGLTLEEEVMYI